MHSEDEKLSTWDEHELGEGEKIAASLDARLGAIASAVRKSQIWRAIGDENLRDGQIAALLREVYWEIHCYHPATTPAGFAMIGRIGPEDKQIMRSLLLHKWDEVEHRVWALDCFKALGGDTERIGSEHRFTSPGAFAVAAVWERLARIVEPLGYLGAEYLFEDLTARLARDALRIVRHRRLPDEGLQFIQDHAHEDIKHSAILRKLVVESVSERPSVGRAILYAFDCFSHVYPLPVWQCAYDRVFNAATVSW